MDLEQVIELVRQAHAIEPSSSRSELTAAAGSLRRLSAWCEGVQVRIAQLLSAASYCPEQDLARASNTSTRTAGRIIERGRAAAEVPSFGDALENGELSGAHVDVLAAALSNVEPEHREQLAERAGHLVEQARAATPEELRKLLAAERRQVEADEAESRLERQRRARRCRTWVDEDGMWNLHARLDPESAVEIDGLLRSTVNRLFADEVPPEALAMPSARQDYLRCLAFIELCRGQSSTSARPHMVWVYDETTPDADGHPRVDLGLGVELPRSALERLARRSKVWPVAKRNGELADARGPLDLGRSQRVANEPQRRALRAFHPSCGVPGCTVQFDYCDIHHLLWWRHGGTTDFHNLLPLCSKHHTMVHAGTLHLTVAADRTVSAAYGPAQAHGPPASSAA